jgi:hypothetical protein
MDQAQGQSEAVTSEAPEAPADDQPKRSLSDFAKGFMDQLDREEAAPSDESPLPEEAQESAEAEEAPPEEDTGPRLSEVEIDGKLYAVPEEIKDGYLRQADYTKKTQEVAQARRHVETMLQAASQAVQASQQFADIIGQIKSADASLQAFHSLDWNDLRATDPVEYAAKQADFVRWQSYRDGLVRNLSDAKQRVDYAQAQEAAQRVQQGAQLLSQQIPGWGEQKMKEIRSAAQRYGYQDAELDGITDPRAVLVLHKAAEYDKLQASRVSRAQQVKNLPPVAKPTARPNQDRAAFQKARESFRKGGGNDLDQLSGLLAQRFSRS